MPTPTTKPLIRAATANDAAALAILGATTFSDTFAAYNTPEDTALFIAEAFSEKHQLRELLDPTFTTYVADDGGLLASFAQIRRGTPPECVPDRSAIEILRFYVDARWHGSGLAQRMMAQSLEHITLAGGRTVYLGVWEQNARGIRFYEKEGFRTVGSHIFHVGTDPQQDLLMMKSLA